MGLRGQQGWDATYQKQFGAERWAKLRTALSERVNQVAVLNSFLSQRNYERAQRELDLVPSTIPLCYKKNKVEDSNSNVDNEEIRHPEEVQQDEWIRLMEEMGNIEKQEHAYWMDGASAVCALFLDVKPGHKVLDMCAAPGGKSLVLANKLFANLNNEVSSGSKEKKSVLVCNEYSKERYTKLGGVLKSFLPEKMFPSHIAGRTAGEGPFVYTTNQDASCQKGEVVFRNLAPEGYNRILIDAPCSSDRHLVHKNQLHSWSDKLYKENAERQLMLLTHASRLLKPGGVMVYSTCALAPAENDELIEKFLMKVAKTTPVEVVPFSVKEAVWLVEKGINPSEVIDAGKWGVLLLPDKSKYGPLYICKIRKKKKD